MLCEEVTALLPGLVDGEHDADPEAALHVETCLRCQAELARYRRLLRTLALLRTRYAEPTPGLLGETLAALTDAAEEGARRTLLSGRRLAYAGRHRRHRSRRGRHRRPAHRPLPQTFTAAGRLKRRVAEAQAASLRSRAVPDSRYPALARTAPKGSSSIGRAPVSKTGGWGFDSLLPCS